MCWTHYNLFSKNLLGCTRVTALNVRVPSSAPTVGAKTRLKNTWLRSLKKQLLFNIMTKINNDSLSQCLLHCLKQTELKYGETLVHSSCLSKHGTFLMWKIHKNKENMSFFFSQKLRITPFINSLLQNVRVGFWVYSQPVILCWLVDCTRIWVWCHIQMTVICLMWLQLISHVVNEHMLFLPLNVLFEIHHAVFRSIAKLQLVGKLWLQFFGIFALTITCDVLIGWSAQ